MYKNKAVIKKVHDIEMLKVKDIVYKASTKNFILTMKNRLNSILSMIYYQNL